MGSGRAQISGKGSSLFVCRRHPRLACRLNMPRHVRTSALSEVSHAAFVAVQPETNLTFPVAAASRVFKASDAMQHMCRCKRVEAVLASVSTQAEVDLTMPEVAAASREFTALGRSVNTLGGLTTGGLTRPLETVGVSTGNSLRKVVSDVSQLTAVSHLQYRKTQCQHRLGRSWHRLSQRHSHLLCSQHEQLDETAVHSVMASQSVCGLHRR